MAISKRFALGAVVGVAAGVIAGMLTAPKSGRETRADIRKKAADLKQDAEGAARSMKRQADDYMHRVEDALDEASSPDRPKKGFWDR